jgi:hypothetical protein
MVIVKAGVYREAVRMMRGGTPQKPIVFLAEPIGSVIVKGSEVVKDWEKVGDAVWRKTGWELAGKLGRETGRDFVFRREQVFCDGKPLQQVERREQMQAGTFWVDMDGKALYVWLPENANPNEKLMEVSIRSVLWTGDYLTPFVHLKGFRFEHCANRAQQGAIHLNERLWLAVGKLFGGMGKRDGAKTGQLREYDRAPLSVQPKWAIGDWRRGWVGFDL